MPEAERLIVNCLILILDGLDETYKAELPAEKTSICHERITTAFIVMEDKWKLMRNAGG